MREPLNKSIGKYLRLQSHASFQRSFTCGAPVGSPEYYQAHREYERCTLLSAWAELFYSRHDEDLDND